MLTRKEQLKILEGILGRELFRKGEEGTFSDYACIDYRHSNGGLACWIIFAESHVMITTSSQSDIKISLADPDLVNKVRKEVPILIQLEENFQDLLDRKKRQMKKPQVEVDKFREDWICKLKKD